MLPPNKAAKIILKGVYKNKKNIIFPTSQFIIFAVVEKIPLLSKIYEKKIVKLYRGKRDFKS
jgi:hypothetical protein